MDDEHPKSDRPDNILQFRGHPKRDEPFVYMGGTAMSCGQHPSLPTRHRWSKVREFKTARGVIRDRMCMTCALTESVDEKGRFT